MAKRRHQEETARAAVAAAQQHSRLSAEGEETVAALGIDAFLPPSTYTIPLRFPTGAPFNALSFGARDSQKQATTPVSTIVKPNPPPKDAIHHPGKTEIEQEVDKEALTMRKLFGAMHKELSRREGKEVMESEASLACVSPKTKKRAVELLDFVQDGMERINTVMARAEKTTVAKLQREAQGVGSVLQHGSDGSNQRGWGHPVTGYGQMATGSPTAKKAPPPTLSPGTDQDSSLLCTEELLFDEPNQNATAGRAEDALEPPPEAVREMRIFEAQDVAMIRELTAIVRERTVKLARARIHREKREKEVRRQQEQLQEQQRLLEQRRQRQRQQESYPKSTMKLKQKSAHQPKPKAQPKQAKQSGNL